MKLSRWSDFPVAINRHLTERLVDRKITADDLNKLRVWVESEPELPSGRGFRDFGSFKIVGEARIRLVSWMLDRFRLEKKSGQSKGFVNHVRNQRR